ncbi:MAG TPA: tetratricopeptide repeat protein [Pyrinomonadaceae bacterium]|nr:tetratricopeptide repeat protein [Pyrinomonadaceae bacterium]
MKRIIFSLVFIFSAFISGVSAQSQMVLQTFESGTKAASKGEFATALGKFQTSLSLAENEPTDKLFRAKIYFNIGVCFYQMKQQTRAIPEFDRAISLDANYEKAFYSLGMAQFELKNFAEAEKAFTSAIRLNKRNGETWFDLAFVYLAQENYESAKAALQKSIKLKSVDAPVSHNNLGVILALAGDFDAAIKEFEIALKKSDGKLVVAERNLQFCKELRQNFSKDLVAKLEFGK